MQDIDSAARTLAGPFVDTLARSHPSGDDELKLSKDEVAYLIKDLCRDLGFCLLAEAANKFESNPPRTIDAFTRAVFEAEGLDPDIANRSMYDQVTRIVTAAFDQSMQR
jgi:hypothetical protein